MDFLTIFGQCALLFLLLLFFLLAVVDVAAAVLPACTTTTLSRACFRSTKIIFYACRCEDPTVAYGVILTEAPRENCFAFLQAHRALTAFRATYAIRKEDEVLVLTSYAVGSTVLAHDIHIQDDLAQGELVATLVELAESSVGANAQGGSLSLSPTASGVALAEKSLTIVQTCLAATT